MKPFVTTLKLIVVADNYADAIKKTRLANLPISCALQFESFPKEISADELEDLMFLKKMADEEEAKAGTEDEGRTFDATDFPALDAYEKAMSEIGNTPTKLPVLKPIETVLLPAPKGREW